MTLPRFYSTTISSHKSANEIGNLVRKYGAKTFSVSFDDFQNPIALSFIMNVPDVGEVPVELVAQTDALFERINSTHGRNRYRAGTQERDRIQAHRVAWRQLRAHVELTLEMVENGIREFHEAFLADILIAIPGGGRQRLAEVYSESHGRLALPAPVIEAEYEEVT